MNAAEQLLAARADADAGASCLWVATQLWPATRLPHCLQQAGAQERKPQVIKDAHLLRRVPIDEATSCCPGCLRHEDHKANPTRWKVDDLQTRPMRCEKCEELVSFTSPAGGGMRVEAAAPRKLSLSLSANTGGAPSAGHTASHVCP